MYKKIIFTFVLCCIIASCGKKGDPVYKVSKKSAILQSIFSNKT